MKLWNYQEHKLFFNEKSVELLSQKYLRPTYCYDTSVVADRARQYQDMVKSAGVATDRVFYALKANAFSAVLGKLRKESIGLDVVSGGEIRVALTNGFSPAEIIFSGVGKTVEEIELALDLGIRQINVESVSELKRIAKLADLHKRNISVVFRINPDVDVKTHPYIATGFRDNKFGMNESDLPELFTIVKSCAFLKWQGLSIHIGSQILDLQNLEEAFIKTKALVDKLNAQGMTVRRCDLGGGLGIFYDRQDLQLESHLLKSYGALVNKYFGTIDCERQYEPGRWLVAHAGFLLAQVQYIKFNGYKRFVVLDSGMNHLLRPALYQAHHEIYPLIQRETQVEYDFVGPICESGDFLAKSRKCSELHEGDYVAIADAGAYGFTMASHYNAHALPKQIEI